MPATKAARPDLAKKRRKKKTATPPTFGSVIRKRRDQLGKTQAQVAKKVNCRPNYIGYLESGARKPSANLIARLAKALDLDAQELLLLANPQVRSASKAGADGSAWDQFRKNKALHTRHNITRGELKALEGIAKLGDVRSVRDFLQLLAVIRQAVTHE